MGISVRVRFSTKANRQRRFENSRKKLVTQLQEKTEELLLGSSRGNGHALVGAKVAGSQLDRNFLLTVCDVHAAQVRQTTADSAIFRVGYVKSNIDRTSGRDQHIAPTGRKNAAVGELLRSKHGLVLRTVLLDDLVKLRHRGGIVPQAKAFSTSSTSEVGSPGPYHPVQ